MWKSKQDIIRRKVLSVYVNLHCEGVSALSCLSFPPVPSISSKDFHMALQVLHHDHYSSSFHPQGFPSEQLLPAHPQCLKMKRKVHHLQYSLCSIGNHPIKAQDAT